MPYSHFSLDERDALQTMMSHGVTTAEIARLLGKHPSSIYREVKRNSPYGSYLGHLASRVSHARRVMSKSFPKRGNGALIARVEQLLREGASPEQISGRIAAEHPAESAWCISYETIYQHIYSQIKVRPELALYLRQGHRQRRKRISGKNKRGTLAGRVFIEDRPAIANRKQRRGDWEGDTMEGKGKKGYFATFTDRKTKYLVACKIQRKTAAQFTAGALRAFSKIPPSLIRTITLDNGKENAFHKKLEDKLGAKVYFANPYHSWERGLNEHTNGLLRQYFPKSMPLHLVHQRTLDKVVKALNNRPRKCLGYRTPHEAFFNLPIALQT